MSGPETINIRPMNEADLDTVLAIEQASFPAPWKRDHFLHEISAPYSFPFVAETNGMLAGYVCLTSLFEEAQILDIAVAPDLRGRGIALALMEYAIALALEKGAEVLALEVRSTNTAAIALYERLGFIRRGLRPRYYEGIDDAVLMEKNLQGESSCSLHP
ncbi:MAG: ribosomal protein S18-alanine N-acetyltransferase [Desulfuromonadales bacterium]|nr:ribosomal protein S18-alanine N-acetyltransferase [Desulfuromonadales bacterium]